MGMGYIRLRERSGVFHRVSVVWYTSPPPTYAHRHPISEADLSCSILVDQLSLCVRNTNTSPRSAFQICCTLPAVVKIPMDFLFLALFSFCRSMAVKQNEN